MSEKKYTDDDPERTLVTLDQLSQTIEVMTSVVNRLRRHLSDQIKAQLDAQESASFPDVGSESVDSESLLATNEHQAERKSTHDSAQQKQRQAQRESFVVEINQQEAEPIRKATKILH